MPKYITLIFLFGLPTNSFFFFDCCNCCLETCKNYTEKDNVNYEENHDYDFWENYIKENCIIKKSEYPHVHWKYPWCWVVSMINMFHKSNTMNEYFSRKNSFDEGNGHKIISIILKMLNKGKTIQFDDNLGNLICESYGYSMHKEESKYITRNQSLLMGYIFNHIIDNKYNNKILYVYNTTKNTIYGDMTSYLQYIYNDYVEYLKKNDDDYINNKNNIDTNCIIFSILPDNFNKEKYKTIKIPKDIKINNNSYILKSFTYLCFTGDYKYNSAADVAGLYLYNYEQNEYVYHQINITKTIKLDDIQNMNFCSYEKKIPLMLLYEI